MKLMIVENDTLHSSFLRSIIGQILEDYDEFEEVADGGQAIEAARRSAPHAVIMDLQMPRVTGIEAAKEIWRQNPATKILFWSNYADEAYVRGVAKIVPREAVYGYVLKSASEERLRLAIRGVFIEDQCVIDREVRGLQQRVVSRSEGLTEIEYEALVDVALGLTDRTMAARRGISIRGAQSRIKHLSGKLGLDAERLCESESSQWFNPRTRLVLTALERGLLNADALRREETALRSWLSEYRAA